MTRAGRTIRIFPFTGRLSRRAGGISSCSYADVGPIKIGSDLPDEKVLFLSDIFPTGYMAAENAETSPATLLPCGVAAPSRRWLFRLLDARRGRVIAIDRVPERLEMAGTHGKAETINFDKEEVYERLNAMTQGRGPDRCIDAAVVKRMAPEA